MLSVLKNIYEIRQKEMKKSSKYFYKKKGKYENEF